MTHYDTAKKVVQRFVSHGYVSYLAGGFVRDLLMGHPSDDIDIVTNAPVNVTQSLFSKTIPVGVNFGIVIVVENGHQFEVATFRKESGYEDGRRPQKIEEATPIEDAKRRDFTINGMFYDPIEECVFDYVHGREDIAKKIVRAIGNPHDRFQEDRLRMVRAIRYAARFGFTIETETMKAILFHAKELFPPVAIERVWQELKKMSLFKNFDQALIMLHESTLLSVIFPSLKGLSSQQVRELVKHLPQFPQEAPTIYKLYELFPHTTILERFALCDYLKLSNREKELTQELEMWRHTKTFDDFDWAHLYAKPHAPICEIITSLHTPNKTHEARRAKLASAIERIEKKMPLITAQHLIEHGIRPGPKLGELLEKAERLAINQGLTSKEQVLQLLFHDP